MAIRAKEKPSEVLLCELSFSCAVIVSVVFCMLSFCHCVSRLASTCCTVSLVQLTSCAGYGAVSALSCTDLDLVGAMLPDLIY